jgi:Mrp family chromosome partitioning ATPase
MWFRKRHRSTADARGWGEVDLPGGGGAATAGLLGTAFAVDDAPPHADRPATRPPLAAPCVDLAVRYRQTQQFRPAARRLARNLVIGPAVSAEVTATYNLLRTQVLQRLRLNAWSTVGIAAPTAGVGTTLTAINLAISLARDLSHTVLLVELNLRVPALRRIFGFDQRQGVADHLLRDVPLPQLLLNPGIDRLVLLPAGAPVANAAELLASARMARLVQELKGRYDRRIVLFDLPPVLAVDDAMAFAPLLDCALLVVEEGATRVGEVQRALDYLGSTGLLGVVLNRSVEQAKGARPPARRGPPPRLLELADHASSASLRPPDRGARAEPWVAPGPFRSGG